MEYGEEGALTERGTPEGVGESRKELVKEWVERIREAKQYWEPRFSKMREHQKFVRGTKQWRGQREDDDRYRANITMRQMSQRTAAVYARNPTFTFERRKKLDFVMWDGKSSSLQLAQQGAQMGDPDAMMLLQEIAETLQSRQMITKMGKTLELVFRHQLEEGKPRFKIQAKQAVRRAKTNGVAYAKVGYQRLMDYAPGTLEQIKDATDKLKTLEMLSADMADGEILENSAEAEKYKLLLRELSEKKEQLLYEGLVFDWPRSTQIIVDPDCSQLKGFVGAEWIAHEFVYSKDRIKKMFGKDLGDSYAKYAPNGKKIRKGGKRQMACFWEVWDLVSQQKLYVCDGYEDFLEEPKESDIYYETGHPFHVLSFNDIEDEDDIYPESDVDLLTSIQREHNRSREAAREHRIANTPAYIAALGAFAKEDKEKLSTHDPFELLEMVGVKVNDPADISKKLMMKPIAPFDPNLYSTDHLTQDMLMVSGDQSANIGPTAGATATESGIAENSRMSGVSSDSDELDEFFSDVASAASDILLLEMSPETVKEIAGAGAVWPDLDRRAVMQDLWLVSRAGSAGRPNRAAEGAILERLMPFLIQMPGISQDWLAKMVVSRASDEIDLEEALADGTPSIVAINKMMQPSTGNPATDPSQQGDQGGDNAEQQPEQQQGAQPAFPVDNSGVTT